MLAQICPSATRSKHFAEQAKVGICDAEDAAYTRPKGVDDEFAVERLDEQNLWNVRMREVESAQCHHSLGGSQ